MGVCCPVLQQKAVQGRVGPADPASLGKAPTIRNLEAQAHDPGWYQESCFAVWYVLGSKKGYKLNRAWLIAPVNYSPRQSDQPNL